MKSKETIEMVIKEFNPDINKEELMNLRETILNFYNNIFPLKVYEEGVYLGMGEYGTRFKLMTNDGKLICYSDYEPRHISEINNIIKEIIKR